MRFIIYLVLMILSIMAMVLGAHFILTTYLQGSVSLTTSDYSDWRAGWALFFCGVVLYKANAFHWENT